MYSVIYTGQFKKSLKKCVKRGLDLKVFTDTLDLLQETGMLPQEYKPHKLAGEYANEFAFEGRRFYDLQRIARHYNESGMWGGNFGSKWFAKKLEGNNPQKNLRDPRNWYLPFK